MWSKYAKKSMTNKKITNETREKVKKQLKIDGADKIHPEMLEEIEKRIAEGRELAEEHKKLLKETGILEEKGAPKETSFPDPEIVKELKKINPIKIYINTTAGKIEFLEEMSVEEYNELKREYVEKCIKIYEYIRKGQTHGVHCLCPSCLFQFYKLTHKKSKIRPEYFLLGLLLIFNTKFVEKDGKKPPKLNWKLVNDLMFQITTNIKYLDDRCSYQERNWKYKIGSRYIKIILEAYRRKIVVDDLLNRPEIKQKNFVKAWLMAVKKINEMDDRRRSEKFSYIKERKKVTYRELERLFNVKLRFLERDLSFLESEDLIYQNRYKKKVYSAGKGKQYKGNLFEKIMKEIKNSILLVKK